MRVNESDEWVRGVAALSAKGTTRMEEIESAHAAVEEGKKKLRWPILDPCCGSMMFYFDKNDPRVLFCDVRREITELCDGRVLKVEPDTIADVTDLPFPDRCKSLVVFDPPHLDVGSGWQVQKCGKLPSDWKAWMARGFAGCWRVLKPEGTLVFKWYEYRISLDALRECFPAPPLFGNRRPKNSKTHWIVFFKEGA